MDHLLNWLALLSKSECGGLYTLILNTPVWHLNTKSTDDNVRCQRSCLSKNPNVHYTDEQAIDPVFLYVHTSAHNCFGFTDNLVEIFRKDLNRHYVGCNSTMSRLHGDDFMPELDCKPKETLVFQLPEGDTGYRRGDCRKRRQKYMKQIASELGEWTMEDVLSIQDGVNGR